MRRRGLLLTAVAALLALAATTATVRVAGRPLDDDRYVVVVMGSDQGPWRSGTVTGGRADAMHVVVVVPSERSASILSFPRDSYVPVPGMGTTRINAALTRGPETSVETVEALTGLEVDDWIVTGLRAFTLGIDEYGGLEVDVPKRLQIDDAVLQPGVQELDGLGVLLYTRDRKTRSDGDFGRNRAQAEVMELLHADLVASDPSVTELLGHVATLRRHTVSSIPAARMPILANLALQIDPDRVERRQAPGTNASRGGAAVVVLGGGAEALYADLRDDGIFNDS